MRMDEIRGVRNKIKSFSSRFDNQKINTSIHSQAARAEPLWKLTLVHMMRQHGFSLIGAGINGAVFGKNSYPYVLKVYRTDAGYEEWLHFSRTHSHNPHVPQIKGNTMRINSVFSCVRLESLLPCPNDKANAFLMPLENAVIGTYPECLAFAERDPDGGEIAKFMRDWEPVGDLTPHNVMMRTNGTVVVVDPIYIEHGAEIDW